MKTTDEFKQTILKYLEERVANDELFAATYVKEGKNIDDCITYILNAVRQSNCNGFTDEEVYSMAVHYYDEDNVEVGKPVNCNVVVNHTIELTEEDKQAAKQKAIDDLIAEERKRITTKAAKPAVKPEIKVQQVSLF